MSFLGDRLRPASYEAGGSSVDAHDLGCELDEVGGSSPRWPRPLLFIALDSHADVSVDGRTIQKRPRQGGLLRISPMSRTLPFHPVICQASRFQGRSKHC